MKTPPLASLLHAREIPEGRGDTMFSNMCAAYDNLSDGLKTTLSELRALHSGEATRARAQPRDRMHCLSKTYLPLRRTPWCVICPKKIGEHCSLIHISPPDLKE